MAEFIKAIEEKKLNEEIMVPVTVLGQSLSLVKKNNRYFAFENKCTHSGCALSEGLLEDLEVECPCHGARFNIESGEVLALPATLPIKTYPTKVADGWVLVEV